FFNPAFDAGLSDATRPTTTPRSAGSLNSLTLSGVTSRASMPSQLGPSSPSNTVTPSGSCTPTLCALTIAGSWLGCCVTDCPPDDRLGSAISTGASTAIPAVVIHIFNFMIVPSDLLDAGDAKPSTG